MSDTLEHYSVWVGGGEVNDFLLTKAAAGWVAASYIVAGYDDVEIEDHNDPDNKCVVIEVNGGIAEATRIPAGVTVRIVDRDN